MEQKFQQLLFLFTSLFLLETGVKAQAIDKKIDSLMTSFHRAGQFDGVLLVATKGDIVYKKSFGLANQEWSIPNTTNTKYRLASITKQFTSMLVMQLVQEGKLRLEAKISEYLPDYPKQAANKITIHQLLSHTSGIPDYDVIPQFTTLHERLFYTRDKFIDLFKNAPLLFEPGTKFRYSNLGYYLLGVIAEKTEGKTYRQMLKTKIFEPLGMNDTDVDSRAVLKNLAYGYEKTYGDTSYMNASFYDPDIAFAFGNIISTADDLFKWDQALYTDKILNDTNRALLFRSNLGKHGYGWFIDEIHGQMFKDLHLVHHGGSINGFSTHIIRMIEDKHTIILLSNLAGSNPKDINLSLIDILYGRPFQLAKRSIGETLFAMIKKKGVDTAIALYKTLRKEEADSYRFAENELATLGYKLANNGYKEEAIKIFELNKEIYPSSDMTHFGLGFGYMMLGDKEKALLWFRKAIEINPQNHNAINFIKKVEAP